MEARVRPAAVSGSWYPGDASLLVHEVERHLSQVSLDPPPAGRLVGLVSPHAGLVYSGPVAAWGYSLVRGSQDLRVVLVGPSHRQAFSGVALAEGSGFATPLGVVPIDEEIASTLERAPSITRSARLHEEEHCLEMQLPFLQHLVPGLRIVPLLLGRQSEADVRKLGSVLGDVLLGRRDVLLVASSDLSHYETAQVAHRLDSLVVGDIERFDEQTLLSRILSTHGHACGGGAIVAVMMAARALGARRAQILRRADSGDEGGRDKRRVVGYVSAAFLGS